MPQRVRFIAILSGLVTAAAWWVSRGVVDLVVVDGQTVRVALLPGWDALLGFLVGAVGLLGLASVIRPASQDPQRSDFRWLPLLTLTVLGLPYLPMLADAIPGLLLLAGPMRGGLWAVILGVVVWSLVAPVAAQDWLSTRWKASLPHATTPLVLMLSAATLMTGMPGEATAPTAPLDMGVRMVLLAAITWATVTSATRAARDAGAAALATVALLLSVPALQTLSTDGGGLGIMSLVAIAAVVRPPLLAGLACGLITWFGTDVIPMAMVILLGRMAAASVTTASRTPAPATLAALVIPFLTAAFIRANGLITVPAPWGPGAGLTAAASGTTMTTGLLGLLFDQRHGLLVWIPAVWIAVPGARALWQHGAVARVQVLTAGAAVMALIAACARHTEWWGGERAQLWPLAALLPLLAPLVAAGWNAAPPLSAQRALRHALLWCGLWMSATLLWSDATASSLRGLPGVSPLLIWISPLNEAWRSAPAFRHDSLATALMHTSAWLTGAGGASLLLRRLRPGSPGGAATQALAAVALAVVSSATMVMVWPHDISLAGPSPLARSRRLSLETFDPRARPAALLYTPLTRRASTDVLPLMDLQVTPGLRTDPQPLRVLLNGRWSLPAGRYRLAVEWTPETLASPDTAGLQIGRTGPPLTTLEIGGTSGRAELEFALPMDAVFVGLRGSPSLERALTRISVTPLSVVPASLRPTTPQVVGATHTPGGLVLVHTDTAGIEPDRGVWVMAGAPSMLSLAESTPVSTAEASPTVTVRLRSDAPANRVTLTSRGWTETVTLSAGVPLDVQVPRTGMPVTPLTITAASSYVPASHIAGSDDRRPLGVWVTRPASADPAVH